MHFERGMGIGSDHMLASDLKPSQNVDPTRQSTWPGQLRVGGIQCKTQNNTWAWGASTQGEAPPNLASSDARWLASEAPMGFDLNCARSWDTRRRALLTEPSVHATSRAHDGKGACQSKPACWDG